MMRSRVPRQHRRYSLPATSTLSPFGLTRTFPEGSDIFQKAFEDLCLNEPNHAVTNSTNNRGYNGLGKIQEDNESDLAESEEDFDIHNDVINDVMNTSRRHSSPSLFQEQRDTTDLPATTKINLKDKSVIIKNHNNFKKEYFKKHGRWPATNPVPSSAKKRPASHYSEKSNTVIAFGTKITK